MTLPVTSFTSELSFTAAAPVGGLVRDRVGGYWVVIGQATEFRVRPRLMMVPRTSQARVRSTRGRCFR